MNSREALDLDHYLPRVEYPFAAANLRNLVPMGSRCNERYKTTGDVLFKNGHRRRAIFPYAYTGTSVCLARSEPFAGSQGHIPRWEIDFTPDAEEVETWNDIFEIRVRYSRDVLDPQYTTWIRAFKIWCKGRMPVTCVGELITALDCYARYLRELGLDDRSFLKAPLFEMLCIRCREGSQRLIRFLLMSVSSESVSVNR
jgi:hypothetical protein